VADGLGGCSLCGGVVGGAVSTGADEGPTDGGADGPGVSLAGDVGPVLPAQAATIAVRTTSMAMPAAPER
jgi:hypothetical protein